jgi:transglutaminase-like putative cysteine protease
MAPRPDKEVKIYLGPSPSIESRHKQIRALADELTDPELSDWEQIERFYDYVRENVTYKNGTLKGALQALRDGDGDCEELTSLFIALCRAHGVPARTVWVPDHCYPEFYLVDENEEGHWLPCQAAGDRAFGTIPELRPILQKGDNFKVPEKKGRQRYVAEFLTGKGGGGKPRVRFIRDEIREP